MRCIRKNLPLLLLVVALVCFGGCTFRARIGSFPPESSDGGDADVTIDAESDAPGEDDASDSDADLDQLDEPDTPVEPCLWVETLSPGSLDDIIDIDFVDAQRGFMAVRRYPGFDDPCLYRTENAGASWSTLFSVDDFVVGLTQTDGGQLVWLWTHGFPGGDNYSRLWASQDGGQGFTQLSELNHEYSLFHFFDSDNGFSVDYFASSFCLSDDGGESWHCANRGYDGYGSPEDLEALGSDLWIVGGHIGWEEDGLGATLLHSPNFGQTFEFFSLRTSSSTERGGTLYGIHVVTETEIWVAGESRQMYYTENGWDTYTQVEGIPEEVDDFYDVSFRGGHGVATASTTNDEIAILESLDFGQSWEIQLTIDKNFLYRTRVEYPPNGNPWVYGLQGFLVRCERE